TFAADPVTITVTDVAPSVQILNPLRFANPLFAFLEEGRPVTLESVVSDSPGDVAAGFSYSWTVTRDGVLYAAGTGANFTFAPDEGGNNLTYVVNLAVTDADGGTGLSGDFRLNFADVGPAVAVTGTPATVTEGTLVTLNSVVTDSPGDTAAG